MLATLIIIFRELIEAGLVVGIVMAATKGVPHRGRWVSYGIAAGIIGACIVALFAEALGKMLAGVGQEVFNASILMFAVLMLGMHNIWMAKHGSSIAAEMKTVGSEVVTGKRSLTALAVVVGIAVLREGSEVVLFLYGIAVSGGSGSLTSMMTGGLIGMALGVGVAMMMYYGLLRIPARKLFAVTSWLIALLAAGMAAQAVVFLQQAGIVTVMADTVWDTSQILSEGSLAGKTLHTLIGYVDRPNQMQLLVYFVTLQTIFGLMRLFNPPVRPAVKVNAVLPRLA